MQVGHDYRKDCTEKEFICKDEFHKRFRRGFHILVSQVHHTEVENMKLLDQYKLKIFKTAANIPSNFIAISPIYNIGGGRSVTNSSNSEENNKKEESAVYMFQRIEVEGKK